MSDKPERAGWLYAGRFCKDCEIEITETDWIYADPDGDYDGEGWRDLTVVRHAECPKEDAA